MKILYRPEIDGLRAIAIISVILYHANFFASGYPLFQGGFIGVDIFFVISGYLITSLILKEIYQTNEFSFKHFYERRIRRILPALLFVMIVSSIAGYFLLLPYSYEGLAKSIISSIFFSSNFYFHYSGNNYGGENSLLKPLLHTWSLSVEEQFYILFPIFLLIAVKFFRKHLFKFLFLGFCLSLIFAEYCSKTTHVSFGFYQLPARGFELLLGSLLSYFELNKKKGGSPKIYSILNKICPSLGIILILYSFIFFNYNKIFHPGIITLIPIVGVALIIWFSKKGEFTTEILSSKILVFLGLISYSLYLWHYPIFAYLRYIDLFNTLHIKYLSITLVVIFSILSYYFIERPFRNKKIISSKLLTTYTLIALIFSLSLCFYILKTEGVKNRFPSIISKPLKYEGGYQFLHGNLGKVALIGDSHAGSLQYHLNEELKKINYNLYSHAGTSYYVQNFNRVDSVRNIYNIDNFIEENKKIDFFLKENKDLIIVFHQRWTNWLLENKHIDNDGEHKEFLELADNWWRNQYLEPINIKTNSQEERQQYLIEGTKLTIENMKNNGNSIILVYPVPVIGFDVPRAVIGKYLNIKDKLKTRNKNNLNIPILGTSYEIYKKQNKIIFDILDNIQGNNIYRIYPDKYFCNRPIKNLCVVNDKENLFYYDHNHLSLEGSKYIVRDVMKIIQEIKINK
jgi:peptidoglycan/LPS O-acetylase OafA/YrhL